MKDRMTESDVSFEEESLDEEAGGPGSLTVSEVTELRNLGRGVSPTAISRSSRNVLFQQCSSGLTW